MLNNPFKNPLSPALFFVKNEWRFLLYGFLMSLWSSPGQTFFISLFSFQIRDELSLTHGEFGTLYAIATTLSAIVLLWIGKLADSQSVHRLSILTLSALSVSSLFFSLIDSTILLLIGLFSLRLSGQGMMYHVYSTAISRRYSTTRGKALAICGFGMNIAEAIFPVLIIFLLGLIDWRMIWIIVSLVAFFSFMPFVRNLTNKKIEPRVNFSKESLEIKINNAISLTRGDAAKDLAFWFVIIWLMVIPGFTITGIFFHQIHISELKNIPILQWSTNYFWYALASIGGAFLSGYLVDKYTAHRIAFLTQLPMLLSCIFLWFGSSQIMLSVFFIFFGLGGGMLQPMINGLLAERYGIRWLGEIKSLIWALSVFSSALSPVIMGLMIDGGSKLNELMLLLASLSLYSFIIPFIWFNIFRSTSYSPKSKNLST